MLLEIRSSLSDYSAMVLEYRGRCSLGVRMYDRNVALFHRPSARITESSIPAFAVAVAAPILKLCPAK